MLYKLDKEFKFQRAALKRVNVETFILVCTDTVLNEHPFLHKEILLKSR